jgi:hypothetical protein
VVLEVTLDTNDVAAAMELLEREECGELDEISPAWAATSDTRDKLLQSNISTADYLHKFPVLKERYGVELVSNFLMKKNVIANQTFAVNFRCPPKA